MKKVIRIHIFKGINLISMAMKLLKNTKKKSSPEQNIKILQVPKKTEYCVSYQVNGA